MKSISYTLLLLSTPLTSCGKLATPSTSSQSNTISWPDKDMADNGDSRWGGMGLGDSEKLSGSGSLKHVYWLDFEGSKVTKDESFIVKNAGLSETVVPAFKVADLGAYYASQSNYTRDQLKELILKDTKAYFDGLNIEFTLTKPEGTHAHVHIGGPNFTKSENTLGVSPLDVGNNRADEDVFVFSQEFSQSKDTNSIALAVQTIAHEVGHSIGARHLNHDDAMMNPAVTIGANLFDVKAPIVGSSGEENTLRILEMALGRTGITNKETSLPEIVSVRNFSTGDVARYTIFTPENYDKNPNHNLTEFDYTWSLEGATVKGPTFQARFSDTLPHTLTLIVSNPETKLEKSYSYQVGKLK